MIFNIVLLTFAIEIKYYAKFESCLRNHENTVIVIPQLRCFQLYSPSASYIGCASYICFASYIGLRPVLEANII